MKIEENIVGYIFKNLSFTKAEEAYIKTKFERIEMLKGTFLLKPDVLVDSQYYVYSGCLRSYFVNNTGKDHTIQFAIKDWWISDYMSYFTQKNSVMNVECLENAVIYKLTRDDMNELCKNVPSIESFFRIKLENAFAAFQKRTLESLSYTAKERYIKFINDFPVINQYVKNYHIASYLGVTSETLSRIRKELANNIP